MKVCIIYFSAFQSLLQRDTNAHLDRGDEVDVICYGLPGDIKLFVDGLLKVYRLIERHIEKESFFDYFLKLSYFWLLTFLKLTFSATTKRYDLIHVVSPPDSMIFVTIIQKLLGARVILNIHDITPDFFMRKLGVSERHIATRLLKYMEKISCHFSDHVLTVTDLWRDKLIARTGIPPSKCSVFMNVCDDRLLGLSKKSKVTNESDFRLLYPGNLGEHFGVETLIRAIPLIKREIPFVQLNIFGNGPLKKYFEKLSRALHLEGVVSIRPPIPLHELILVMRQVDVGIVPTSDGTFAGEALSTKSLEFIAVGTPVVISRTTASQYYYDDSMVMYFKPGDYEDLARCIIELYRHPEKRKELIENSKEFNKRHNWEYYKKVYLKVVDDLCKPC